ncbi:MAG: endonuclease/exonuclease/phosphatase family protein, partial [Pseudomonadota bacterium]
MRTLAVAGLAALALSLMGALAPPIDSLSHFRWHIVLGVLALAALCALRRRLRLALALAIPAIAAGVSILPYVWPNAPERSVGATTLLQMNLLYQSDLASARAAVLSTAPDVVTMQEVTDAHWREIDSWPFAHKIRCHSADTGISTAILSTLPLAGDPLPCAPLNRMTAVRLAFDSGPVWVVAVHASWPWPRSQWRDLPAQEPFLSPLTGPVVIAG